MARARTLVPAFFTDERVVSVSMAARLLFQGLWTEADREGRLEDKPQTLKMRLFPADQVDVSALLEELVGAGLIVRYAVLGRSYLLVPKFKEHQHVHPKEAPSKLPPLPLPTVSPEKQTIHDSDMPMHDSLARELHGEPSNYTASPSDVQAFGCSGLQAFRPSALKIAGEKPPAASKAKAPKVERPPDPRHAPLVKALCVTFEEIRGGSYPFKPRDAGDVTKLLATGTEPDAIAHAWARALRHQGFPKVSTLAELNTHLAHFVGTGPPSVVDLRKPVTPSTFTESRTVENF